MEPEITFREFLKKDFEKVSDIIRITWEYDKYYNPSAAILAANAYLRLCLTDQTFTKVALLGDRPVGIIMGNDIRNHKCPFKIRLRAIQSVLRLLLSKDGRESVKFLRNVDKTDQALLAGCNETFDGELSFFAIHPDFRGLGIGKKLFESFLRYMDKERIESFYLFTDTSCSYDFYERQGMKQLNARTETFPIPLVKEVMTFFLYGSTNKELKK